MSRVHCLDSGTFNIIDNATFAGEGLIETVRTDERRLLSYAADTAVRVTRYEKDGSWLMRRGLKKHLRRTTASALSSSRTKPMNSPSKKFIRT